MVQQETPRLEMTCRGSSSDLTLKWGLRHQPESSEKLKQKVQEETTDLFVFLKFFCVGKFRACDHAYDILGLGWGHPPLAVADPRLSQGWMELQVTTPRRGVLPALRQKQIRDSN